MKGRPRRKEPTPYDGLKFLRHGRIGVISHSSWGVDDGHGGRLIDFTVEWADGTCSPLRSWSTNRLEAFLFPSYTAA